MNTAYRLVLITLFGFFMVTCQKEINPGNQPVIPNPTNPVTVTASVVGRVTNSMGDPVAGAAVKAGTSFTTTDINGEFTLTDAQLIDKAAYVTVTKAGYFDGSRTFIARQGKKHFVEIQLMPKIEVGSINGSTGGTINLGNGSAITLPANSVVVNSSGTAYTGPVKVSMTWIDPTSKDLLRQMPGDLRGTDATNTEVGMESYGMMGVELNGTSGEKLQIAPGKKATLKFPLPSPVQGAAPATIALWSFNETTGLWKQEGTATKTGSSYTADVSHFSWWNCDLPITTAAYFTATFVDQNGQPLIGYHVSVYRTNNTYSGAHGLTDGTGFITGRVPANEQLVLRIDAQYGCYTVIYTQNIGPFNANTTTNLGNITVTLNTASAVTLNGIAKDCSGNPVTNGFIEVLNNGATFRANITNGNFSIVFPKCSAGDITYYVVDKTADQQSTAVTAMVSPGSTTNLGTISACGTSSYEFLDYTFDNQTESLTAADSLHAYSQPGAIFTQVGGGGGIGKYIQFNFSGQGTGTFPVGGLFVQDANGVMQQFTGTQQVGGITVTITSNGTGAGSFVAGTLSGVAVGSNGVSHPVQASFRIRRN
jgi:hypothetical protein